MKIIVKENQFEKIMGVRNVPVDLLIEQVVNNAMENQLTVLQQKINQLINDPKKEKEALDNVSMLLHLGRQGFVLQIGEQKFPMKKTVQGVYGVLIPQGKSITTSKIPMSTFMKEIEKIPEYKAIVETNPQIKSKLESGYIYNKIYSDNMDQGFFELRIQGSLDDRKEEKLAVDIKRPYPLGEFFQNNKVVFKLPDSVGGYFAVLSSSSLMADLTIIELVPAPPVQSQQTQMAPVKIDFQGLGDVFNFGDVTFANEEKVNQALQEYIQRMKGYVEKFGEPFIKYVQRQNPTIYGYSSVDGDPEQQIIGKYKPCSGNKTRKDYDLCLSTERSKIIANLLNQNLPEFGGAFKYKGMGQTTKWGPGWTPERPTMPAQTSPNRRYLLNKMKPFHLATKVN